MISFRRADLLDEYSNKDFQCRLELVFQTTENGINESDSENLYMGILNLEIDSPTTLNEQLSIWHRVNEALRPYQATISVETPEDARKFYYESTQNMVSFVAVSTLHFEERIFGISTSVKQNLSEYNNNDQLDRVTITFTIKA